MKIFKLKPFHRWAKSMKMAESQLKQAVTEIASGLNDGELGSGLYKKRVARAGGGKRGGHRTIVAFRHERAIFLFGYSKNDREDIDSDQLQQMRVLTKQFLNLTEKQIKDMVSSGSLVEVK